MNKYKAIKVGGKKIDEHRHIMQITLGSKLCKDECVHHIDGDKSNNDISNLTIVSRSEHARIHMKGAIVGYETKEKLRIANFKSMTQNKITKEQAVEIYNSANVSISDLCSKYGISRSVIYSIRKGRTWSLATGHKNIKT